MQSYMVIHPMHVALFVEKRLAILDCRKMMVIIFITIICHFSFFACHTGSAFGLGPAFWDGWQEGRRERGQVCRVVLRSWLGSLRQQRKVPM